MKRILLFTLLLLIVINMDIYAEETNKKIKINFDTSSVLIFSNTSGANINKGIFVFSVSHTELDAVDIMVNIENTDKVWRFNNVKLKLQNNIFVSESFSLDWDGLDKDKKTAIDGQYNIKILIADTKDNMLENNSHDFYIDNQAPDIQKIFINPKDNIYLKIEAQVIDDTEVSKAKLQFQNISNKQEEILLQQDIFQKGIYFGIISLEKIDNRLPFEGFIVVDDKANNSSKSKFILKINPEVKVDAASNNIYFSRETLPHEIRLDGTFLIGTLEVSGKNYEHSYPIEENTWLRKLEIKNSNNDKALTPFLQGNGKWEQANLRDFLIQGENHLQYIITDYFSKAYINDIKVIINYDTELPKIKKVSKWSETDLVVEMDEKVKINSTNKLINAGTNTLTDTLFEVDLINSSGAKTTFPATGRLINNDTNIEIKLDFVIKTKMESSDKILVRIIKLQDIAGNIVDKLESEEYTYDKL